MGFGERAGFGEASLGVSAAPSGSALVILNAFVTSLYCLDASKVPEVCSQNSGDSLTVLQ